MIDWARAVAEGVVSSGEADALAAVFHDLGDGFVIVDRGVLADDELEAADRVEVWLMTPGRVQ